MACHRQRRTSSPFACLGKMSSLILVNWFVIRKRLKTPQSVQLGWLVRVR